jgi:6-pyruvoyltetrahydropterin/6-carboxytetrahydropterin synthase
MIIHSVTRAHEIDAGHRVYQHGGKCANLHGHRYRFEFTCVAPGGLDDLGMVVDFSVIKDTVCAWLDQNWDHRMLIWVGDPILPLLRDIDASVVQVPANPTAENLAMMMVRDLAPKLLLGSGVKMISCTVHETAKCSACYIEHSS